MPTTKTPDSAVSAQQGSFASSHPGNEEIGSGVIAGFRNGLANTGDQLVLRLEMLFNEVNQTTRYELSA